jgi:hypothetical protein
MKQVTSMSRMEIIIHPHCILISRMGMKELHKKFMSSA